MLIFPNGGHIVESVAELPALQNAKIIYVDFETTSGDPKLKALDPWRHCDVAGLCITVDDEPSAWYLPVAHQYGNNLPREAVEKWWLNVVSSCDMWVNHNIKFDAHVSANALGVLAECRLYCTLTMAKIIDSDRTFRGGYGLEALSLAWLHEDISDYSQRLAPYLHRNKDYGRVAIEVLGEYGCQDVLTARRLHRYIEAHLPERCKRVRDIELALTPLLFEMERTGMHVHPQELRIGEFQALNRLQEIDAELAGIVGRAFRPHVNDDCFDVLCNQYGLPVMGYTDTGNPSFDKFALVQYSHHPHAPANVIALMQEYRHLNTLIGFFLRPYQHLEIDGVLHPSYNQAVRTGRMSCRNPNAQQLSPDAKKLIHPPPGYSFISTDASQIEFRIICHYIQNPKAIAAYHENPDTDFHAWVAEMCGMARDPAKSINFMMGYGGGKKLAIKMLASNMEIVGRLQAEIDKLVAAGKINAAEADTTFATLCEEHAGRVFRRYHETFPELRQTSYRASRALKQKGYVFNLYGRERKLPEQFAHHAFSTLCQSTAADLVKERMIALAIELRGSPVRFVAQVHDEIVLIAPTEIARDPRLLCAITELLEQPECDLRVPVRWDIGVSDKDWLEASSSGLKNKYMGNSGQNPDFSCLGVYT